MGDQTVLTGLQRVKTFEKFLMVDVRYVGNLVNAQELVDGLVRELHFPIRIVGHDAYVDLLNDGLNKVNDGLPFCPYLIEASDHRIQFLIEVRKTVAFVGISSEGDGKVLVLYRFKQSL